MDRLDLHSHSTNSFDGCDSPEAMILSAIEKGVAIYALTDHCEVNRWFPIDHYSFEPFPQDTFDFAHDFESAMEDNTRLKEKYKGKIKFLSGIELGNIQHDTGLAISIAKDKRLDFVIGSLHQNIGKDDFAFLDYNSENVRELLEKYFCEEYIVCKEGDFDTLGHITYPLRYIVGENNINVNIMDYKSMIAECFREVIKRGKCIEINTSGLRQKYKKSFPDKELLELYKDLGGKYVTTGSDAHNTDDISKGFSYAGELTEHFDFKLCYFEKRNLKEIK